VAAETPAQRHWFSEFSPRTSEDIGLTNSFIDEWSVLAECDILLVPNSTYAYTAAMVNPNLIEAWRPSLPHGGMVRFDPWNDTPLRYDRIEGYPQILQEIEDDSRQ
jgi:hypothetical protein